MRSSTTLVRPTTKPSTWRPRTMFSYEGCSFCGDTGAMIKLIFDASTASDMPLTTERKTLSPRSLGNKG
ncbi:hypothetical protein D3C72_801080 [compost metagenome]